MLSTLSTRTLKRCIAAELEKPDAHYLFALLTELNSRARRNYIS